MENIDFFGIKVDKYETNERNGKHESTANPEKSF